MDFLDPTNLLNKVDFPTLGLPSIAMEKLAKDSPFKKDLCSGLSLTAFNEHRQCDNEIVDTICVGEPDWDR